MFSSSAMYFLGGIGIGASASWSMDWFMLMVEILQEMAQISHIFMGKKADDASCRCSMIFPVNQAVKAVDRWRVKLGMTYDFMTAPWSWDITPKKTMMMMMMMISHWLVELHVSTFLVIFSAAWRSWNQSTTHPPWGYVVSTCVNHLSATLRCHWVCSNCS